MVLTTIYMVHKELHGAMVEIDIEEVRTKNPDGTGFADDDGRESLVVQGMYMPRSWCRCGGDRLLTRARWMCFTVFFFEEGCIANGDQDQALEEDRRPNRVTKAPSHGCRTAVDGRQEKQHKVRSSTASRFPLWTDTASRVP